MRGGFTFCGIDIADLGLEYAPEASDMYVFRPAPTKAHVETHDGHDGGSFYGVTMQPKEFELRCFFERQNIYSGLMARIFEVFRRGRSGKLIFQERPWIYYNATVNEEPETNDIVSKVGGIITIHLTAYYPFGRSDIMHCNQNNLWYDDIMLNSAVVTAESMIPTTEFSNLSGSMTLAEPLLLNPGTERSPVTIDITGDVGDGLTITNLTNGQRLTVVQLKPAVTGENGFLRINARNGQVTLHTFSGSVENIAPGYLYHDSGFLMLEPAMVAKRNVYTTYENGTTIKLVEPLDQDYTGEYIYINGAWQEIAAQPDALTLTLKYSTGTRGSETTTILPMNKLNIYAESSAEISKIKFNYLPTYA